jgi:hypothetical protein
MKKLALALIAVLVAVLPVFAGGYAGVEFYPDKSTFIFAGRGFGPNFNANIWSTEGDQVGVTAGPKVGPFALGFGASMVGTEAGYGNLDCSFNLGFGKFHWKSYNLIQKSVRDEVDDFAMSRNWITVEKFPIGIVGHNKKSGDNDSAFFWGLFAELGTMSMFQSNRICFAVNLRDTGAFWATWRVGL